MNTISTYPMKNSTILRLNYERDRIDTAPEYQRLGGVWDLAKKQLLIDSIINDYDIPKIYFHAFQNPRTVRGKEVIYAIIDGRQRVESIWEFMDDKYALADDFKFIKDEKVTAAGLNYSDLANKYPNLKVMFDSFILPIICVDTDDIDLIEDMFSRLNEAMPLNSAEKRNAMGGPLPKIITDVSEHKFFTQRVKFANKRYQHKEVSVRLLFLEDSLAKKKLIDTKREYLDGFVKFHKQNPDVDIDPITKSVKAILNQMWTIFDDKDQLLRSQSSVVIYFLLAKLALKQGRFNLITRSKLVEFVNKIDKNREIAEKNLASADFELLDYDRMSIQGTNDASSIRDRVRIICKYFGIDGNLQTD
jgi:hypothetical protein